MNTENDSSSIEALVAKHQEEIGKLLSQNRTLAAQKAEIERAFEGVISSVSWKVTRPLRLLSALVSKIFPLLRFSRALPRLERGHNTRVEGSRICIGGSSPTISLVFTAEDLAACKGWIEIEGTVKAVDNHAFFFLYYRTSEAFNDHERFWVTFVDGKPLRQLFYLPAGVRELRLDPFSIEGEVRIEDFAIRHHGTLQFLLRLFLKHFGTAMTNPALFCAKLKKALAIFREGGFTALRVRFFADQIANNYQEWVRQYDTLEDRDLQRIREAVKLLPCCPLISVVMPVWNTPERWLRAAIESVRAQCYAHWELCIADDASTEPHVRPVLEEYAALDSRIQVVFREANGHISAASNSALALARGEYVALLDHDDELSPHALYMVAEALSRTPGAALLYSDEDKITAYGLRFNPYFKSGWNPLLLLAQNYICHLSVFRSDLIREIGGFRTEVEGAQDWDLILRASARLSEAEIVHIPHVLYHWRVIEGSTAQSTAYKPYVLDAQKKAVSDCLAAKRLDAEVEILEAIAQLRVHFKVPAPEPLVSLIIPTRDQLGYLKRGLESIFAKTSYANFEVIIVDNGSVERDTLAYFETIGKDSRVRVLRDERPFNFSRLNNEAAKQARGSFLGFLNNDLEVISPDWLSELVSLAALEETGAAGARLLYPNDLIQHAGIILGIGGVAGHNHKGQRRASPGYFNRAILPQHLSAVTAACLVMRREVFEAVQGFDEALSIAFNDVDLCLRIRKAGYKIAYGAYAELYHYESVSRGYENTPEKFARFETEIELMKTRWGKTLLEDPYYNPNLTLLTEDFAFAFPPRVEKPWLIP